MKIISGDIRKKIEARYGNPILYSKDCEGLAISINKSGLQRVSITTLKRLFGFARSVDQPRIYTLDILANYIGYNDWGSLIANGNKTQNVLSDSKPLPIIDSEKLDIQLLQHQIFISLATKTINIERIVFLCKRLGKKPEIIHFIIEMIGIAAQQKNIRFLEQVFNLPNLFDEQAHSQLQIYHVTQAYGLMLRNQTDLAEELIEVIAANKKAQHFLIEWFVDEDHLRGYYGKLLDAYYQHKNFRIQDKLFYYALKYKQAVQEENTLQRKEWYRKIKTLKLPTQLHEIPAARYAGICLSEEYSHSFRSGSSYCQFIEQYIFSREYNRALGFMFYVSRELFRGKREDCLIQVVNNFEKIYPLNARKLTNQGDEIMVQNQYLIYKAYVVYLQGQRKRATQIFGNIDTNLFNPFIYKEIYRDYSYVSGKLQRT